METLIMDNNIPVDDAGVELEEISGEEITQPFDPSKIRVSTKNTTIDLLLKRISRGELDLSPAFQREADIWKEQVQSRLIESLLIRIPIPAFYLDATDEDRWLVVDGLQRFTALRRFVLDKNLHLHGMEFLNELDGKSFDDLSPRYQRRILETEVVVYQIEQGTPPNVKFNIFKRINTSGLPLSPQEIRHALNQGPVVEWLKRLANSQEFLRATAHGVSVKRMTDRELVLRFMAFSLTPYTKYPGDFDTFLNDAMALLNRSEKLYPELGKSFLQAMNSAYGIFGDSAFRKLYSRDAKRTPVNKALFEIWAVNLSQLKPAQIMRLTKDREKLIERFISLMNDRGFDQAVSQGTGDKSKVNLRFREVARIIEETLV